MYLERLFLANIGPIEQASFAMPFDASGRPTPVILLGSNGSGKTNALAVITDALFEFQAAGYTDVLPTAGTGRRYFRLLGGVTRRTGTSYSLAALSFRTTTAHHLYFERSGELTSDEAQKIAPEEFWPVMGWGTESKDEKFAQIGPEAAVEAFATGAYCYFPASRSEKPDWLNDSGTPNPVFDTSARLRGKLGRPLFVESGIDETIQWLMGLVLESRMNVAPVPLAPGMAPFLLGQGDATLHQNASATLTAATLILRQVLGNNAARFTWMGRQSPTKIGVDVPGKPLLRSLHSLSSGQATLLSIFLTLLRYADQSRAGLPTTAADVEGICLVDEIDAHMHVDLQHRALPNLIGMFPSVQFILTSHSPLFVLGASSHLGQDRVSLISLPTGTVVDAEAYSEFKHALDVMRGTRAFTEEVTAAAAETSEKLLVWLEGETDPIYLETAARSLGRGSLLDAVEFSWIGAKEEGKNTIFHTGKDALNHTLAFLRANPNFAKREVLFLYDNDANKPDADHGNLHVRSVPNDPQNQRITAGIEHLLPDSVFTDGVISRRESAKPNGTRVTTEEVDKMSLCKIICGHDPDANNFSAFAQVLDVIEAIALPDHS